MQNFVEIGRTIAEI